MLLGIHNKLALTFISLCAATALQAKTYYGPTNLTDQKVDSITVFGPAKLDKVIADSITITGTLNFKKIEVAKKTEITGPVNGDDGIFGDFNATGPTKLEHCKINSLNVTGPLSASFVTVANKATIIGPFEANDSQFADITIISDDIALTNTTVKNIEIKKNDTNAEQTLELDGNTIVTGNVTFESGKGKVLMEKTAKVQGKINGGTASEATPDKGDKDDKDDRDDQNNQGGNGKQ